MSSVNTSESGALTFNPNYDKDVASPDPNKQANDPGKSNTESPTGKLDATGLVKQMEECFRTLFNIFESQSLQGNNPYTQYRSFLRVNGFRMKKFDSLYTDSLDLLTTLTTKTNITDVRGLASSGLVPNNSDVISEGKRRIKKDLSEFFKNEGEILLESQVHFNLNDNQKQDSGCLSSFQRTNYQTFTSAWTKMLATLALEVRNPEVELDKAMRLEDKASKENESSSTADTEDALKKATEKANNILNSTEYSDADVLREELVTYQKTYLKDMASQKDAAKVRSVRAKAAGAGVVLSTGGLALTRYQTYRQMSKADAKEEQETLDATKSQRIKNAFGVERGDTDVDHANKVVSTFKELETQMNLLAKEDSGLKSYLKSQKVNLDNFDKACKDTDEGCQRAMSNAVKGTESWISAHKTQLDPSGEEFRRMDKQLKDLRKSYRGLIENQFLNAGGRPSEMEELVERYSDYDVKQLQTVAADHLNSALFPTEKNNRFLTDYANLQQELATNPTLKSKWNRKGGFLFTDTERNALLDVGDKSKQGKKDIYAVGENLKGKLKIQNGKDFDYKGASSSAKKFDPKQQLSDYKSHLRDQQTATRSSIYEDKAFTSDLSNDSREGLKNLVKKNGSNSPRLTLDEAHDAVAKTAGDTANREKVEALDKMTNGLTETLASRLIASPRRRKIAKSSRRRKTRVSRRRKSKKRVSRKRNVSRGVWDSTKNEFKKVGHSIKKGFGKVASKVAASKPGQAVARSYSKANRPQVCKDCLKLRCGAADPSITTLTIPKGWTKGTTINITLLSGRKIPVKPPDTMKVGQKLEVKIPPLPTTMLVPYKIWSEAQKKGAKVVEIPWHYGRTVSVPIPPNAPVGSELRYTPPEPTEDEWEKICLGKGGVCHTNCLQLSPACAKCLKKQHDEWMKDKIDPKTKQMKINPKTKKPWTCNKKNGCFQKLQSECANSMKSRIEGTTARNKAGEAVCPTDVLQDFGDYANIAQAPELVGMGIGIIDWAVAGCLEGICEAALV